MRDYYHVIRRIAWTLFFVMLMIIGTHLRIPALHETQQPASTFLQIFSNLSAGNVKVLNLFSLGLGPYMISLIFWSTLSMMEIDWVTNLSKREQGFIIRGLTLFIAFFQAYATVTHFGTGIDFSAFPGFSKIQVEMGLILVLVAGAMLVSFLADMNLKKGIGKQMMLIMPGLLLNTPSLLTSGQTGAHAFFNTRTGMIVAIIVTLVFIYIATFLYRSELRIDVQQTSLDVDFKSSYIPIKVLPAGAMPFMFVVTIFSLPQLLVLIPALQNTKFLYWTLQIFTYSTIPGIIAYGVIATLLTWGFAQVNVRVFKIAKSLRESGDYILDVLPGIETERYLKRKLNHLIVFSSLFMIVISSIPMLIGLKIQGVSNLAFYFGSIFMAILMIDNIREEVKFLTAKPHYKLF
ncbi:accessory Sec system protein translocase subunit SecY2 [Lactococcus termiticola]|uniref:Preprotein translocase subunit SecY n=1 Tax=Lactococcus termiticola TaxID=2169526 RepID=A0A2R5HE43_9LACT|nr:accessory Sec system protein translocase subunit SecY2 [Lactococcus termiticola]GBG96354.1 preprotein translocase subunit SecY [Lactococcus termiticola]